ncbi:MAG: queuosine salvage family protein [Candidatus Paceibacterota bacterium]|jgi:hypothetical protein|nr:queuosine salvage family protein [Candidatus Paceibacterota bacterium]
MNDPYIKSMENVWKGTEHVRVNEGKLLELAGRMKESEMEVPAWDVIPVQPERNCSLSHWLNFICWINTINFAFSNFEPPFNKFAVEYPEGSFWSGAFAMEACFSRAYREGTPVFDAKYMRKISKKDVERIFRPTDKDHQIPMLWERWRIFHEIGEVLLDRYGGLWQNLFEEARWRAFRNGKGAVEQLVEFFPSFQDYRYYKSSLLCFHKRAKLLVMMYYGRAVNSEGRFPLIEDIDDIGPIADYEVPKALKFLGVLEYSPEFEAMLNDRYVFSENDDQEVESRLAMSYAMKRLCEEAGVNMAQADYYIWNMGRKSKDPHILVPTTDY